MLTAVLALVLLLTALLAIPVILTFEVSWRQAFQDDISLQWAFGLVRIRIRPFQSKGLSWEGEKRQPRIGRSGRSPSKKRNVFAAIRRKTFRRRIIKFISDLWRAIHKKDISLHVRAGLGDPADTGQLWAVVGPMAGILANAREASIRIEPEFFDATFELDSSGSIRLIPLRIIFLAVLLLLSPSVWQGIRDMRVVR